MAHGKKNDWRSSVCALSKIPDSRSARPRRHDEVMVLRVVVVRLHGVLLSPRPVVLAQSHARPSGTRPPRSRGRCRRRRRRSRRGRRSGPRCCWRHQAPHCLSCRCQGPRDLLLLPSPCAVGVSLNLRTLLRTSHHIGGYDQLVMDWTLMT